MQASTGTNAPLESKEKNLLVQHFWIKRDMRRLEAGVRQKNLEALAEPIRDRLQLLCQGQCFYGPVLDACASLEC